MELTRDELKNHCVKSLSKMNKFGKVKHQDYTNYITYQINKAVLYMIEKLERIEALYEPREFGKGLSREERDMEVQKILEEE